MWMCFGLWSLVFGEYAFPPVSLAGRRSLEVFGGCARKISKGTEVLIFEFLRPNGLLFDSKPKGVISLSAGVANLLPGPGYVTTVTGMLLEGGQGAWAQPPAAKRAKPDAAAAEASSERGEVETPPEGGGGREATTEPDGVPRQRPAAPGEDTSADTASAVAALGMLAAPFDPNEVSEPRVLSAPLPPGLMALRLANKCSS